MHARAERVLARAERVWGAGAELRVSAVPASRGGQTQPYTPLLYTPRLVPTMKRAGGCAGGADAGSCCEPPARH
jgi:hypothetical protein